MSFTRDELRPLDIFEGLPDEQLDWLREHGERITLEPGEHMFDRGQVADALWSRGQGSDPGFRGDRRPVAARGDHCQGASDGHAPILEDDPLSSAHRSRGAIRGSATRRLAVQGVARRQSRSRPQARSADVGSSARRRAAGAAGRKDDGARTAVSRPCTRAEQSGRCGPPRGGVALRTPSETSRARDRACAPPRERTGVGEARTNPEPRWAG